MAPEANRRDCRLDVRGEHLWRACFVTRGAKFKYFDLRDIVLSSEPTNLFWAEAPCLRPGYIEWADDLCLASTARGRRREYRWRVELVKSARFNTDYYFLSIVVLILLELQCYQQQLRAHQEAMDASQERGMPLLANHSLPTILKRPVTRFSCKM